MTTHISRPSHAEPSSRHPPVVLRAEIPDTYDVSPIGPPMPGGLAVEPDTGASA